MNLFCNKCQKKPMILNDSELEELKKYNEYTCSECINKEMEEEEE